jgi:hypothetical protein
MWGAILNRKEAWADVENGDVYVTDQDGAAAECSQWE